MNYIDITPEIKAVRESTLCNQTRFWTQRDFDDEINVLNRELSAARAELRYALSALEDASEYIHCRKSDIRRFEHFAKRAIIWADDIIRLNADLDNMCQWRTEVAAERPRLPLLPKWIPSS